MIARSIHDERRRWEELAIGLRGQCDELSDQLAMAREELVEAREEITRLRAKCSGLSKALADALWLEEEGK